MSEQMQPGRELDALIAEKVMGLNVLGSTPCLRDPECSGYFVAVDGRGDIEQPVYLEHCFCKIKEPDAVEILGHTATCLEVVPEYSADIRMAWEVVNKLTTPAPTGQAWDFALNKIEGICAASFRYQKGGDWITAEAETAPMAVCQAALKALEAIDATK